MKSIHRIKVFRHPGAGRGPVADSRLDSGWSLSSCLPTASPVGRNDYGYAVMFATLLIAFMRPIVTAHAHTSPVPHEHPHANTLDGALMSYETLALTGLACIAAAGIVLALTRIRRRK